MVCMSLAPERASIYLPRCTELCSSTSSEASGPHTFRTMFQEEGQAAAAVAAAA